MKCNQSTVKSDNNSLQFMTEYKAIIVLLVYSNCSTVSPTGEQTSVQPEPEPETTNSITTEEMTTINDATTTSAQYGPLDIRGTFEKLSYHNEFMLQRTDNN